MRAMKRFALLSFSAALLTGCAGLPAKQEPGEQAGAAYGAFLAAQYAGRERATDDATRFYQTALAAAPGERFLVERAFMAALTNGDFDEAARLAEMDAGPESTDRLARVLLASRAVRDGRYQRAVDELDGADLGPFNRVIGSLVLAWAYEGLGDADAALGALSAPGDAPILGHLMTLHRALILDRHGRAKEAEAAYAEALDSGLMRPLVVDAYGRHLERAGRSAEALELYAEQLAANPADPAALIGERRAREGGRVDPFVASPAEGASIAIFGPAWTLASNAPSELAIVYLRLALYLDPENGVARQILGDLLARAALDEDALAVYSGADDVSPFYVSSKVAEALTLFRLEREDEAITRLKALVDETGADSARRALADGYRALERYDEARALYDILINERAAAGEEPDWRLLYSRAVTLERTDRWPEAEADFQAALALSPEEPSILNYLGYTWVDRGEHIDEAFDMIRRAVAAQPDAGYIVDSLGWAHFKRGEFDEAVIQLERAVELDPQDPTINDHLGDAYWRAGRFLEASYQWNRAMTLEPTDMQRAELETKLADGLPALDQPVYASP